MRPHIAPELPLEAAAMHFPTLSLGKVLVGAAVVLAVTTGAAYAAATVTSRDIVDGTIRSVDVANGTLKSADVQDNSLKSLDVLNGTLTSADLAPDSVGQSEIATDGVAATEIADNSIDSGEIVDFGLSNQDVGVLTATVNANGTLATSSGGVTVSKLGTGQYSVDFGRNVTACAFAGTIADPGTGIQTGIMDVADRAGNANAVFVETREVGAGGLADRAYHLIVVC
jgi:hypothetical protein